MNLFPTLSQLVDYMKRFIRQVNCREHFEEAKRSAPFILIKYQLAYESDEEDQNNIDQLLEKAQRLAELVNPHPANANLQIRLPNTIFANAIAGVVSEYYWRDFLNLGKEELVCETDFTEAANQIDLETINGGKRIEVRSSFPRNGISFALCHPEHQFDILGPYVNNTYKPGEIRKEFYVRTLFEAENPVDIIDSIKKDGFSLYLTGGATLSMMNTPGIYLEKRLLPEDALCAAGQALYRVVPFSRALDTFQIKAMIQQSTFQL